MSTTPDPRAVATLLRTRLREHHQIELSHAQCVELVAAQPALVTENAQPARSPAEADQLPWGARSTTIPILRIFSVEAALQFYVEFLGFTLDFGGPAGGEGTAYYGQVSRAHTTLHLTQVGYDPNPGATVMIWISGVGELREELDGRREHVRVWGPAVWVPDVEQAPWDARVLTIGDPFGNHLHFNEPNDSSLRAAVPRWSSEAPRSA